MHPFVTGDFNGHSQFWWSDGDTTAEGSEIENLISSLGRSQLISEPTNFEPNKNHSCIDLEIGFMTGLTHFSLRGTCPLFLGLGTY